MPVLTISNTFVVLMGLSIVFIGLITIIILCKIVSLICQAIDSRKKKHISAPPKSMDNQTIDTTIPNRQELIAVVSTAIAEYSGTDVSAIRIHSIKKL